jgi:hypothetical protein
MTFKNPAPQNQAARGLEAEQLRALALTALSRFLGLVNTPENTVGQEHALYRG